jgi:hypothetical protein
MPGHYYPSRFRRSVQSLNLRRPDPVRSGKGGGGYAALASFWNSHNTQILGLGLALLVRNGATNWAGFRVGSSGLKRTRMVADRSYGMSAGCWRSRGVVGFAALHPPYTSRFACVRLCRCRDVRGPCEPKRQQAAAVRMDREPAGMPVLLGTGCRRCGCTWLCPEGTTHDSLG